MTPHRARKMRMLIFERIPDANLFRLLEPGETLVLVGKVQEYLLVVVPSRYLQAEVQAFSFGSFHRTAHQLENRRRILLSFIFYKNAFNFHNFLLNVISQNKNKKKTHQPDIKSKRTFVKMNSRVVDGAPSNGPLLEHSTFLHLGISLYRLAQCSAITDRFSLQARVAKWINKFELQVLITFLGMTLQVVIASIIHFRTQWLSHVHLQYFMNIDFNCFYLIAMQVTSDGCI